MRKSSSVSIKAIDYIIFSEKLYNKTSNMCFLAGGKNFSLNITPQKIRFELEAESKL
jgi:hypothetical protein